MTYAWVDRLNASAFVAPTDDRLDPDGKRRYATGRLTDYLRHLVWDFVTDSGPSCADALDAVHQLSRADWRDDPALAIADIDQLCAHWRIAAEQAERQGIPAEIIAPRGVWLVYTKAAGLFQKYHAALVKMRLVERVSEAEAA